MGFIGGALLVEPPYPSNGVDLLLFQRNNDLIVLVFEVFLNLDHVGHECVGTYLGELKVSLCICLLLVESIDKPHEDVLVKDAKYFCDLPVDAMQLRVMLALGERLLDGGRVTSDQNLMEVAVKDIGFLMLHAAELCLLEDDSFEGSVSIHIGEYVRWSILRSLDAPIASAKCLLELEA